MTADRLNLMINEVKKAADSLPTGDLKKDLNLIDDILIYINFYLESFDMEVNGVKLTTAQRIALRKCYNHFREF
jgi:hypothetical protein